MYIAGHHNAFYSQAKAGSAGVSYYNIGSTRNGIDEITVHHSDPVTDDAFGEAMPDEIQQGTDLEITLDWIEYDTIVQALHQQNSNLTNNPLTPATMGYTNINVGLTLTSLAGTLVLVPVAGTPAAAQLGANHCRSYPVAIVVSDFRTLLSSKHRQGPCKFRCYPNASAQAVVILTSLPSGCVATNPTGATTTSPYFSGF